MPKRPLIALTSDVRREKRTLGFVFQSYWESVEAAGGLPLQIPPLAGESLVPEVLAPFDGVVIVGGEDLDPALYGEEPLATHLPLPDVRQKFDLALGRYLLESSLPVLGICFGCQLLCVLSGGSLVQDIPSQVENPLVHGGRYPDLPRHPIDVGPGTRLRGIVGADRIEVNSAHHQAPKRLGGGLVASATSPDGVLEAFEAPGDRFLIGAEWHPDLMGDEPGGRDLFRALVEAAAAR